MKRILLQKRCSTAGHWLIQHINYRFFGSLMEAMTRAKASCSNIQMCRSSVLLYARVKLRPSTMACNRLVHRSLFLAMPTACSIAMPYTSWSANLTILASAAYPGKKELLLRMVILYHPKAREPTGSMNPCSKNWIFNITPP
ncbi:hypothetical protein D3C85_1198760 [compost metagenome]